jgi:hypothetical protein
VLRVAPGEGSGATAEFLWVLYVQPYSPPSKPYVHSRDNPALVTTGSASMLDMIFLAVGCGCFAVAIAYSYACDRL